MLPLFGVGITIDYALILVTRWREERARGTRGDAAVHRAMATANRTARSSPAERGRPARAGAGWCPVRRPDLLRRLPAAGHRGVLGGRQGIAELPGVYAVAAPPAPTGAPNGSALLTVLPVDEGGSTAGHDTIGRVIGAVPEGILVGGNVTQQIDYVDVTYRAFPWLLALVAAVTFVMLARAFRSLVLPLKAIVLNLLSLGAVLGAMVIF